MTYNASTNSLVIRSAPSVVTATYNPAALAISTLFNIAIANSVISNVMVQSAPSIATASVNPSALIGIQMTQISGPTPNYTIVKYISPVQSWGS